MAFLLKFFFLMSVVNGEDFPCVKERDKLCNPDLVNFKDEREVMLCLKRKGNLIEENSACYNYVARKLKEYFPPVVHEKPNPTPVAIPSQSKKIEGPKSEFSEEQEKQYQDCLSQWKRSWYGNPQKECKERALKSNNFLSMKKCIKKYNKKHKDFEDQIIFENFLLSICEDGVNSEPEMEKCFSNTIKSESDYGKAFNMCLPDMKRCLEKLNKIKSSGGNKIKKELYYEYCSSQSDQPDVSFQCFIKYVNHSNQRFIKNKKLVAHLCDDGSKMCFDRLFLGRDLKKLTYEDYELASTVCDQTDYYKVFNCVDQPCLEKEKCKRVKNCYDQNKCVDLKCYDKSLSWGKCVFTQMKDEKFPLINAKEFCDQPNENIKKCQRNFLKNHSLPLYLVKMACLYDDQEYLSCTEDYFSGKKYFSDQNIKKVIKQDEESVIPWLCLFSKDEEKNCLVQKLKDEFEKKQVKENEKNIWVKDQALSCYTSSEEFKKCYAEYEDFFFHHTKDNAGASSSVGKKICSVPHSGIRLCLLDKLYSKKFITLPSFFSKGSYEFNFDIHYADCLKDFLSNLFNELNPPGQQWLCRHQEFEQKTLVQKAQYCRFQPEVSICKNLIDELSKMSDDQLREACSELDRAERATSNFPAWNPITKECKKRKMFKNRPND